jgi:hypothetical protein
MMLVKPAMLRYCPNIHCFESEALNRTSRSILIFAYNLDLWTCIFFIPPIINNIFRIINQRKAESFLFRYLYYNITLNISTCFGPQGTIFTESNQTNKHETKSSHFCIQLAWCKRVEFLKCRHLMYSSCKNVMALDYSIFEAAYLTKLRQYWAEEYVCSSKE